MSEPNAQRGGFAPFVAAHPILCGTLVLCAIAIAGGVWAFLSDGLDLAPEQLANPSAALQWAASGAVGAVAIIATFRIHARGRTPAWRLVPLIVFAAWQAAIAYDCRNAPMDKPAEQLFFGQSPECFLFILAASIPLVVALFVILRVLDRHVSASVAAMGGLGTASMATWLMQFFHPFGMNLADVWTQLAAIGIVVGGSVYFKQILPTRGAKMRT